MIVVDIQTRQAAEYLVHSLDAFEQQKAIKVGMLRAAKVFSRRGRGNLRSRLKGKGKGNLLGAFGVVYRKQYVMSLAGYTGRGHHAHLVDLGTRRRSTKSGKNRGIMPANYFWSDARQSEERSAMQEILHGIEMAIQRIQSRM